MSSLSSLSCGAILIALLASCGPGDAADTHAGPAELRGVWLTNVDSDVLDSREGIADAMQFLADHHFNVVFPVVWNRGLTLYPSAVMDSLFGLPIMPAFSGRDPLQEVIEEAHARCIAVIPWFEYGFAAHHVRTEKHIMEQKPHWMERDRDGGVLTKNDFSWMNAHHPEVQDFIEALVLEVVRQYPVDGIQGDDRLPANPIEGGYSAFTDSLYRAEAGNPPPHDYRDPDWQRWRADRLNAVGKRLYESVKAGNPEIIVSWSPSPYPWSLDEYLQDWPAWLRGGYADIVHPQAYRYDIDRYRATIDAMTAYSLGISEEQRRKIYPGVLMNVGDYTADPEFLLEMIQYNREAGFDGEVFFFYEGLRKDDDRLATQLLNTVYGQPASLPFRTPSR